MKKYIIFTQDNCSYCDKVKELITKNGDEYEEIKVKDVQDFKSKGHTTVPQVYEHKGGYAEIKELYTNT